MKMSFRDEINVGKFGMVSVRKRSINKPETKKVIRYGRAANKFSILNLGIG